MWTRSGDKRTTSDRVIARERGQSQPGREGRRRGQNEKTQRNCMYRTTDPGRLSIVFIRKEKRKGSKWHNAQSNRQTECDIFPVEWFSRAKLDPDERNTWKRNEKNTYDTTEIHLRHSHNLFDNCKPKYSVCMYCLCIETYQSDMAHQLGSLQRKKKKKIAISWIVQNKIKN